MVLGTVVDVLGSSYRMPGARILLGDDGERVGLISGGCLEKDVVEHAFEWTADGPKTVLYDTRGDELRPQGAWGSGCDGVVQLLLERVDPSRDTPGALDALADVLERRQAGVLATVYAAGDDLAGLVGRHVFANASGIRGADVLPSPVASQIEAIAQEAADWPRARSLKLEWADESASILVEPLRPPLDLLIFGAGDDVQPVAGLAEQMGWDVRVADCWPALATRKRFPGARQVVCGPTETLLDEVEVDSNTFAVVMTHDFADDLTVLPDLIAQEPAFVGLLGPRSRTKRLMQKLHERGRLPEPEALDCLQTPVGLDVGGEAPSEVALSIVSAVLAAKNGRDGGRLQASEGSIHDAHERITLDLSEET